MKNTIYKNSLAKKISAVVLSGLMMLPFAAPAVAGAVVMDITLPIASITSPVDGAMVSGTTLPVNATATDNVGVTKVELYIDGVLDLTDTSSPYAFTLNTTSLTDGAHNLQAKAYDAANNVGNSSVVNLTVNNTSPDVTAPVVVITSPLNAATVSGAISVVSTITDASAIAKSELYVDGVLSSTLTTSPFTTFSLNTAALTNDSHTLLVKAYDVAANVGSSASVSVTSSNTSSDTIAPVAAITTPLEGAALSGASAAVNVTATDAVGVTKVELYVDGTLKETDVSSPYSFLLDTTALAEGAHTLQAKAYDAANNVGSSTVVNVTVNNTNPDIVAPVAQITSPATGSTVSGTAVVVDVNATDAVGVTKVELYVDGVLKATDTTSLYSFTLDTTTLSNASHALMAKAYDAAGNVGSSTSLNVTVNNVVVTPGGDDDENDDEDSHEDEDSHVDEDQHNGDDEDSHEDEDRHVDEDQGDHYSQNGEHENQGNNNEEDED
ncbi:MAG: fibronectin type III domain-containing protein [Candidatus Peregrinibacteria bacterium GW2011_GWC2_39_14]|nr:MAG: Repeat-containing protein [Candidatus Peregrinibacteria bacterium GW2011_GWA2_38_36]KKR07203.1 MAG: fibronectin type III domain-containing protein [Candidatus Peregrinibacteria bacterium GW2011_GWC2_39_14]